jgi:hypothetical protein
MLKRHIRALGRPPGSYRTDPEISGEIARDLSLTVSELYSLAAREAAIPGLLLDKRLKSAGIRKDELAKVHPKVLRDLQRVCGGCASATTCARDFIRANGVDDIPKYCPNEQTLQALSQEASLKEESGARPL